MFSRLCNRHKMYPLVLLGLLKWTSTVVEKRSSRREMLSDFLLLLFVRSFIRFLVPLSRPSFCSIFSYLSSNFFSPIFFSFFMSDLLSDFLSHFLVPFLVRYFVLFLVRISVWYFVRFLVRYFVLISCPIFCRICLPDLNFSVLENGVSVCERKA